MKTLSKLILAAAAMTAPFAFGADTPAESSPSHNASKPHGGPAPAALKAGQNRCLVGGQPYVVATKSGCAKAGGMWSRTTPTPSAADAAVTGTKAPEAGMGTTEKTTPGANAPGGTSETPPAAP